MKNALYVLLGVMAGFMLAGVLIFVSRAPAGEPIILLPAPTKAPLAVHIIGAVPRPGLYELAEGARVQDGIDAAGGMLAEASVETLNLAALLADGQQLIIPYKDGREVTTASGTVDLPSSESELPFPTEPPTDSFDAGLLNLNTATLEELESLPGIGTTLAQRILDYRDQNGFYVIEDIMNVDGIKDTIFEQIKDFITVY
jgi:competence protein ComEA